MKLEDVKIKGYHFDPETQDKLGSFYFIFDDCEDDWVRVSPISNMKSMYVVTVVRGCEDSTMYVTSIDGEHELNLKNFETWINKEVKAA